MKTPIEKMREIIDKYENQEFEINVYTDVWLKLGSIMYEITITSKSSSKSIISNYKTIGGFEKELLKLIEKFKKLQL